LDTFIALVSELPDDRDGLDLGELADLFVDAQWVVSRVKGWAAVIAAEADERQAMIRAKGTPSDTWLAQNLNLSRKQASLVLYQARKLQAVPLARDAVLGGQITWEHGRAVGKAMDHMPASLTDEQSRQAEEMLVDIARKTTPREVERAAAWVAAQVDPEHANRSEEERLASERAIALRNRHFMWWREDGSVCFRGSLPLVEGEALTTAIDAIANQTRRNQVEAGDPAGGVPSRTQRRADALAWLAGHAGLRNPVPDVVVTVNYEDLRKEAAGAGVMPDGEPVSAGALRRMCCDANIIPIVLGASSEPLDVGRSQRSVPAGLRRALVERDRQCAFPSCDIPAAQCEAHHLKPWWKGGPTRLDNLVLLCPHHHGFVEPDTQDGRDQWRVFIGTDGFPVFIPPKRYPHQRPMRHSNAPRLPDIYSGPQLAADQISPADSVVLRQ